MIFRFCMAIVALCMGITVACAEDPAKKDNSDLKTIKDKASYGIGLNIGNNIKRDGLDLNLDLLAKGLRDAVGGKKPLLTDEQLREAMIAFQEVVRKQQEELQK